MAKNYNFGGYTRVRVKTTIDTEIVRSDTFSIDVKTGPLSPVKISKKGDAIVLSRPWYWFLFGFFFQLSRARVKIGLPQLQGLEIADNSSASVAGLNSPDEFKLMLSQASVFSGDLKTGDARLEISGASQAEFNGSCDNIFLRVQGNSVLSGVLDAAGNADIVVSDNSVIKLAGSAGNIVADVNNVSNADMSDFPAQDISIKLNRLCNVTIKLDGKLDADVAGASKLSWLGNPVMGTINITTGSLLLQS